MLLRNKHGISLLDECKRETVELKLPWPPSNHYYDNAIKRAKTGRRYMARKISVRGQKFRQDVCSIFFKQKVKSFGKTRVAMTLEFYPPDLRRRDYDNTLKAIQDSLTYGGVYDDDSQIKQGHWYEKDVSSPGYVRVMIEEI